MKSKTAAILRHTFDSLILIFISTVLVLLVLWASGEYCKTIILYLADVDIKLFIATLIVIPAILAWLFPVQVISSIRSSSLLLCFRHFSLLAKVLVTGLIALWSGTRLEILDTEICVLPDVMFLYVGFLAIVTLIGLTAAAFHLYLRNKSEFVKTNPEIDDRPIRKLEEDRIPGFKNIAEKILSHLQLGTETDNHGSNVAIIGPYGSGKTSLCNLIEDTYNRTPNNQKRVKIIFCRFEAWQYLTAAAAVRGLLDCIVRQVKKNVDSPELSIIPEQYLEALGAYPHWLLKILSIFLRRKRSIDEVVYSLQDILLRIDRKVVVFVDDLDRLESHSAKAQDAVSAALNRLQNLTNVQYVLCVGLSMTIDKDDKPRKTNYDLLKSTRFQELIPDMPSEDILNRIKALRNKALSLDENMFYPWHEKESDDPLKYHDMLDLFRSNKASQIIKLIQTPRELKTVERETCEKWKNLNGEISWYDLILINTIKACELPVFEWIINEKSKFLEGPFDLYEKDEQKKEELQDSIESELKKQVSTKTEVRFKLVQEVLLDLFPNFMKGLDSTSRREPYPWEQKLSYNPVKSLLNVSYFERFKSGRVPDTEISDQSILQYIRKIKKDDFQREEFEKGFLDSFQKLTNDFNRFQQFSGLLTRDLAIEICDCILEWMCDRKNWNVWDPPDQYALSVMLDVKSIFDNAGQFYVARSLERQQQAPGATKNLDEWVTRKREELMVKDIIVAIFFSRKFFAEKTVMGNMLESHFLSGDESIWGKLKGGRYYLIWVLNALIHSESYVQNRDKITRLIIEKAKSDDSGEILDSVIMSLVETSTPSKSKVSVEEHGFVVNKVENGKIYNMKIMLPLILELENHEFKDPVIAKAYEHLLEKYANELGQLDT